MQTTLQIGGRSVRLDVFEPHAAGPHPAALLLHGAGGNTSFWLDRLARPIAESGVSVYALHYFDRTGTMRASLQTLNDGVHVPLWLETIRETLAYMAAQPRVKPQVMALVGISLGAFLSLAVATLPETPSLKAIVEVSGGLVPPFEANATAAFPPTLILHGDADTVVPVAFAHALEARLEALQVPHAIEIFRGEGHWFGETAQRRILSETAHFLGLHLGLAQEALIKS